MFTGGSRMDLGSTVTQTPIRIRLFEVKSRHVSKMASHHSLKVPGYPLTMPTSRSRPARALITGATSGIGLEIARVLAASGVSLVLVARTPERLDAVTDELSHTHPALDIEVIAADLTTDTGVDRVARRLQSDDAPVEFLVNNAGFGLHADVHESALSDERAMWELLGWAPLALCHAVIPGMLRRGRGWVLNVSSLAAEMPAGTYSAAKAHTLTLSRSLAARYRSRGIRVTALLPGFVRTEFHDRMGLSETGVPRWAWASATTVARDGVRAVFDGRSVCVSDARYRILAPMLRRLPLGLVGRWHFNDRRRS